MFKDLEILCVENGCGAYFTWTATEQEFYQSKGFTNSPKRCKKCRDLKKQRYEQKNIETSSKHFYK